MKVYLEAVDPEDRKVRLKKLLVFGQRQREVGRLAREHGNQDKQYHHWKKGARARAIVQKYTGKDHHADSYDWSGGHKKPAERSSNDRKKLAFKVLRQSRHERNNPGQIMRKHKMGRLVGAWARRRLVSKQPA